MSILNSIQIILVETTHSGNIGSVARAMKTMQLSQLTLVNPQVTIDDQTKALAAGAIDLIEKVKIVKTLDEAIAQCDFVIGASARERRLNWPHLNPKQAAELVLTKALQDSQIALVFGRERIGLTNEELQKCDYHLSIPANPNYSSLNLAMSVQIIAYELYQAFLANQTNATTNINNINKKTESTLSYPKKENLAQFYDHLESILLQTQFSQPDRSEHMMSRLRLVFNRAQLDQQELNIFRGILSAIEKSLAAKAKKE